MPREEFIEEACAKSLYVLTSETRLCIGRGDMSN